MTRASFLAVAVPPLLIFASGVTQDPPTHGAMPLPITRTYDVGGVNRLEYRVTWTDTGSVEDLDDGEMVCQNRCNGQKHFAHSTCDSSCDSACRAIHQRTLDPEWRYVDQNRNKSEFNSMIDIARAGTRFGANAPEEAVTYTVRTDIQGAFEDPTTKSSKYRLQVNFRHFNEKPCAGTIRDMKGRVYDVSVQWKFYRDVEADGKVIRTNGPSGTTPFGQVLIPENKFSDFHRESCRCNIITEDKEQGFVPGGSGSTGGGTPTSTGGTGTTGATGVTGTAGGTGTTGGSERTGGEVGFVPEGGLILGPNPLGPLINERNQQTIGFDVTCEDMNRGEAIFTNPFPTPLVLNIPPGTMLDTDDDEVQDLMILVAVLMTAPPALLLTDGGVSQTRAKLRVSCLEMNKHEPTTKTKYRIVPSRDPVLSRLAQIANKALIRGPWDQARIWIYTDSASYEDIDKRLIPAPSEAGYVSLLRDVARAGAALGVSRYDKCFAPTLLEALDATPDDLSWLAKQIATRNPRSLVAWGRSGASSISTALAETGKKGRAQAAAAVVSALCSSGSTEVQQVGLSILKAVQETQRPMLVTENLAAAWQLCRTAEPQIAAESRALLEAYNPASKEFYLSNIGRKG